MTSRNGYSAKVVLTLRLSDRELPLSRVGPNEVSLRDPGVTAAPSAAQLIIQVDDGSDVLDIFLPNGIASDSYEVEYVKRSA